MRRIRFSIASLLGLVLFLAVAFAALREANDFWDSGVLTLTLGLLLTSILLAVHRTGERRASWLGVALFGWSYLIASQIPPLESRLLTTKGLAYLDSKVPGREQTFSIRLALANSATTRAAQALAVSSDGRTLASSRQGTVRLWDLSTGTLLTGQFGTSENFLRIGHSILALVVAFVGGVLSRFLFQRVRGRCSVETVPSPPPPLESQSY